MFGEFISVVVVVVVVVFGGRPMNRNVGKGGFLRALVMGRSCVDACIGLFDLQKSWRSGCCLKYLLVRARRLLKTFGFSVQVVAHVVILSSASGDYFCVRGCSPQESAMTRQPRARSCITRAASSGAPVLGKCIGQLYALVSEKLSGPRLEARSHRSSELCSACGRSIWRARGWRRRTLSIMWTSSP